MYVNSAWMGWALAKDLINSSYSTLMFSKQGETDALLLQNNSPTLLEVLLQNLQTWVHSPIIDIAMVEENRYLS